MWKTCASTCGDCAKACNKAFHHCLTQAALAKRTARADGSDAGGLRGFLRPFGGDAVSKQHARAALVRRLRDACKRCAQECESFDTDLEMKACQQECQRCEESCRKMIQSAANGRTGESSQTPAGRPTRNQKLRSSEATPANQNHPRPIREAQLTPRARPRVISFRDPPEIKLCRGVSAWRGL